MPGSVRNGGGLLAGLLRCGHCGRKLRVHGGAKSAVRYECNDARINHGARTSCIAFSNLRIDSAISDEVLRVIAPLGLDAALQTITDGEHSGTEQLRQRELALEQARYEAKQILLSIRSQISTLKLDIPGVQLIGTYPIQGTSDEEVVQVLYTKSTVQGTLPDYKKMFDVPPAEVVQCLNPAFDL